jgi:hypothetical protein
MERNIQEEIVYRVTGIDPKFTGRFRNPFRRDQTPSCFWQWYKGYLRLIDNSDKRYFNMNCWDMVMEKHSCDFEDAKKLVREWNLGIPTKVVTPEDNFEITLQHDTRPWKLIDAIYWGKYGITIKQLESDEVQPVKEYRFNSRRYRDRMFTKYPQMGYAIPAKNKIKIYSPHEKPKFITNAKNDDLFFSGYSITAPLFIASSYKDGRVLMNLGYSVRGLQGESMLPSAPILKKMSQSSKDVYVALDGDEAGRNNTQKLVEESQKLGITNIKAFDFPKEFEQYGKDYADVRSKIVNPFHMKKIIDGLL